MVFLGLFQACSVDPEYYSQSTPEMFFDTQSKVYQRMGRPFTHWAWAMADHQAHSNLVILQEMTTDEMLVPSRYNDWYDGGNYLRMYHHDFTPTTPGLNDAWRAFSMGVAQTWSAKDDIDQYVDFEALKFPEGSRDAILMQLQTLAAFFYLHGLDLFGGVPLYVSNNDELQARASDVETFEFIEGLLKEALPKLPKKTELGAMETGSINQATAALMLARLYFNAGPYIRQDRFSDCATLCQEIINGTYGAYKLEDDWTNIFGFNNDRSTEIIWTVPSHYAQSERSVGVHSGHYGMNEYWGNGEVGNRNNGYCLVPSLDVNGKSYLYGSSNPSSNGTYRLGSPFAKFHEKDIRKQLNAYEGEGKWRGMFYFGELVNPVTGNVCHGGNRQIKPDEVVTLVDQIARIIPQAGAEADHGKEGARWGEENSGVRLGKFSPIPWLSEKTYRGNSDIPVFRLAEAYYMLAECKLRAGDKSGAASLINDVRKRYFPEGDPDPVTASNLDEWRMLDEWMVEFIGEGRRRTDLIRWDKYTTESWWDHPADGPAKAHFNRFPIPEQAMGSNNLIEQNPGYN
ncbi:MULTISPECIES: RagB/SusD family nutrient uptake outer membrane protein [unclassified Parabacteroides]|nr:MULTISPECIES: RagB/SusD family nutrient uptake outer membrane protein [unclassified Parabacteroides]